MNRLPASAPLLLAATFALTGLSPSLAFAQAASAPTKTLSTATPPPAASAPSITVDFPGGSLTKLLAALSSPDNAPFNLIGEKENLAVELPPFSVRNADPHSLAMALDQMLRAQGLVVSVTPGNVYVIAKARLTATSIKKTTEPEPARFGSFLLKSHLEEKLSIEDITGAIRAAWELSPDHDPAALRLKFHPATSLLLASGPDEAVKTVQTVVTSLRPTYLPSSNLSPSLSPGEEAKRLQSVADEVRRRRAMRESSQLIGAATEEDKKTTDALMLLMKSLSADLPSADSAPTSANSLSSSPKSQPETYTPEETLRRLEEAKRLADERAKTVADEIARRRALRDQMKPGKPAEPSSPATAEKK